MRKQNHSNPTELQHNGRLNNSVARGRKCKGRNALQHGVFSDAVLIPGEDSGEYKQLLAELMDEWKPAGPTFRDEVIELANLMWKRRRLKRYIQTRLLAGTHDPRNPSFDETWGDVMFIHYLRSEPENCFDKHAKKYLRRDKIDNLEQKFPLENYQSTSEWVQAIIGEILSASVKPEFDTPELGDRADELREASRQWKAACQVAGTIMHTDELLEYELKQSEQLEARIARKIKFLVELKAMQKMLDET